MLVLIATAALSYFGYDTVRKAQIRQKTLEFIEKTNEDKDIFNLFEQIRLIKRKYKDDIDFSDVYREFLEHIGSAPVSNSHTRYERRDYDYIIHLLNFYETWSIGLQANSLDEDMLREFWRRPLLLHWIALAKFVYSYRIEREDSEAFVNAEALADRWASPSERSEVNARLKQWQAFIKQRSLCNPLSRDFFAAMLHRNM